MSKVYAEDDSFSFLHQFLLSENFPSVFVLCDQNTRRHCLPLLQNRLAHATLIHIESGEEHKDLAACEHIWNILTRAQAPRQSLLLNLGGGMISDVGGFAAGCYKRGIRFANLPTTLLAMADAAIGAKCGINFLGYKNQIGLFHSPEALFIYPKFLQTLPKRELLSGWAEVLKHYLIADKASFEQIAAMLALAQREDAPAQLPPNLPKTNTDSGFQFWKETISKNIAIKKKIVAQDPTEENTRKALNFGHTIGHAVESFFLIQAGNHLLHGEAVAIGMVAESYIARQKNLLSEDELTSITTVIQRSFKLPRIEPANFDLLLTFLKQDKKNEGNANRFTLLRGIGNFAINQPVAPELIIQSLQFFNTIVSA